MNRSILTPSVSSIIASSGLKRHKKHPIYSVFEGRADMLEASSMRVMGLYGLYGGCFSRVQPIQTRVVRHTARLLAEIMDLTALEQRGIAPLFTIEVSEG